MPASRERSKRVPKMAGSMWDQSRLRGCVVEDAHVAFVELDGGAVVEEAAVGRT